MPRAIPTPMSWRPSSAMWLAAHPPWPRVQMESQTSTTVLGDVLEGITWSACRTIDVNVRFLAQARRHVQRARARPHLQLSK